MIETCTFCRGEFPEDDIRTFDYDDEARACPDCAVSADPCEYCGRARLTCVMT